MTEDMATGRAIRPRLGKPMRILFDIKSESGSDNMMINGISFKMEFEAGDLEDLNQQIILKLDALRVNLPEDDLHLSPKNLSEFVEDLIETGQTAFNLVMNKSAREKFRTYEDAARLGNRKILITVRTPPQYRLFWEMLYPSYVEDADVSRFWGFSHTLGRGYYEHETPDFLTLKKGMFSAVHDDLPDSIREVARLEAMVKEFGRRWDLKIDFENLEKAIAAIGGLSSKNLTRLFHNSDFRFGILHFACHHENPPVGAGASGAYLSLTSRQQELDLYLGSLIANQERGFVNKPFVFLNACQSSTTGHMLQTISFPSSLIKFGAGGVIATACTMPDNFASAFGVAFYDRLLALSLKTTTEDEKVVEYPDRASIAEALLDTRLHFLKTCNNPLGLAYGLYATPEQEIDVTGYDE